MFRCLSRLVTVGCLVSNYYTAEVVFKIVSVFEGNLVSCYCGCWVVS